MTFQDVLDFLGKQGIALIGVFLGGLSLYLQRRDKRPKLKIVDVKVAIMNVRFTDDGGGGTLLTAAPGVSLRLQNPGDKDIKLASVHLCRRNLLLHRSCTKIAFVSTHTSLGPIKAG